MKKTENSQLGFTLAEILITLSIIGVVAALTIPTLIQRTGNEELVSRLLKAYSTLSQATEAIITENGGVKTWITDSDALYEKYKTHLRNAKECGSAKQCFNQFSENTSYRKLNGEQYSKNWNENASYRNLILSDGTQIAFQLKNISCMHSGYGSEYVCAWINVDVNGPKGPNIIGRDVFQFALKENGLYPAGCDSDEDVCSITGSGQASDGWGCACKVISEGAMNY